MNKELMFSSASNEWETPQDLFNNLNGKHHFTLDPAATEENTKCTKYFTLKEDGLKQSWENEVVFCNPPYGREISKWVEKAYEEANKNSRSRPIIVMLLPARTDTKWFHEYVMYADEIMFIRGRLKFGNCKSAAPFPSMIVEYSHRWPLPRFPGGPVISTGDKLGNHI